MAPSDHRTHDVPIRPRPGGVGGQLAWESSCSCGYGIVADSPEAAIIAMASHLTTVDWNEP